MEALGTYLKDIREKANLSIDKVIEETHIVRKFLEAIENDEFSMFPGEAYLKGFLRTYSEYLGLDPDDIVKRYEKIKIAEEPTPMEQLIPKPRIDLKPVAVVSSLVLLSIITIIGIIFLIINISKNNPDLSKKVNIEKKTDKTSNKNPLNTTIYQMVEKEKKFNLKKGDSVEFNIGQDKENIIVKELSPTVIINDTKGKEYILIKSYPYKIDLNNDQINEFEVTLDDWDDKSASIMLKLYGDEGSPSVTDSTSTSNTSTINLQGDNIEKIISKPAIEDILCDLSFQDECLLRYQLDNNPQIENYYKSGSYISLKAQKNMIIWFSNAGAASMNFKNYNKILKAGDTGKIEVKLIKWSLNANGENELQIGSLK